MKKDDVMLGGEYAVKVSDKVVPVVITDEHPAGGWVGTNQKTGKQVRIKSAQRLRGWWDDYLKGGDDEEPKTMPTRKHAKAMVAAEQGNARLAEERRKSPDGMTASERAMAESAQGAKDAESEPEAKEPKKRATRANADAEGGQLSGLDAAAKVLEEAGEPLSCKAIVERAFEAGYWRSDGKTPAATVYSAILREINNKGEKSRFRKVKRGRFTLKA